MVVPAVIGAFDMHLVLALIHLSLALLLGLTSKGHLNLLIITLREALHCLTVRDLASCHDRYRGGQAKHHRG